jgi:uncharacterized membrane protein
VSASPQEGENGAVTSRHPFLAYTSLRLTLFLLPFVALLAILRDVFWALLGAAVISGVTSLFVLSRRRDEMSAALAERQARAEERLQERAAAEDAWDDEQRGTPPPTV